LLADCWQLCQHRRAVHAQQTSSAEQGPGAVGDEVGALLRHPVTAAPDDLEGEIVAVSLKLLQDR
jgi:hypothetical protein